MDTTILKTKMMINKKPKKKSLFLLAGILLLIAVLITTYLLLSEKNVKKPPSSSEMKNSSQVNNEPKAPPKVAPDKDIITKGILYKDSPIILNDNTNNKGKGRDKNKGKSNQNNFQLLFSLNPAASIINSKINVTINSIQLINTSSVLDLNIENKTNENLNINLNKTFLLNGINTSFSPTDSNSDSILIPQNTKQNVKLYFNNFDYVGNSYSFKTTLNYGITKDVTLLIDVK